MNPNYTNPDDSDSNRHPTNIEQRLKQLQPRPVTLDAGAILLAARHGAEQPVTLPDTMAGGRSAGRTSIGTVGWPAIAAAFVCGTAAGVLLTCIVFIRAGGEASVTADSNSEAPVESAGRKENVTTDEIANHLPQETAAANIPATRTPAANASVQARWSRSEWLVSNRLIEANRLRPSGELPLMAGNYALQSTVTARSGDRQVVGETAKEIGPVTTDPVGVDRPAPTRSMDRTRLLDELLGVHSESLL